MRKHLGPRLIIWSENLSIILKNSNDHMITRTYQMYLKKIEEDGEKEKLLLKNWKKTFPTYCTTEVEIFPEVR